MSIFTKHDETTAPEGSAQVLAKIKDRYGFVPNLAAFISESPAALEAVLHLSESFDKTSLSPQEQQVILLTVSALNGCSYCKTAHTALAKMAELDSKTIESIISLQPLKDNKLNTLRDFTKSLVEEKGFISEEKMKVFLKAGYTKAQIFEVVMGVALKTLTNYSNHLSKAEPNAEFLAMAKATAAA